MQAVCAAGTQQQQQANIESPLCGLILCISAATRPAEQQRAVPFPPELRRASRAAGTASTPIQRKQQHWLGGCRDPQKATLVHKAAILNSLTGLVSGGGEQERLKMWHRALCVRRSKERRDGPDNERSATLRSYLIRHQSFPLLHNEDPGQLFGLGQNLQQRQKMAFFSPVRGLPILDHVIIFCRLVQGYSLQAVLTLHLYLPCTGPLLLWIFIFILPYYSFISISCTGEGSATPSVCLSQTVNDFVCIIQRERKKREREALQASCPGPELWVVPQGRVEFNWKCASLFPFHLFFLIKQK